MGRNVGVGYALPLHFCPYIFSIAKENFVSLSKIMKYGTTK